MDIVITLPKSFSWDEYTKEIQHALDNEEVLNFKVPYLPKVIKGDKCYVVHQGYVRGFMYIVGTSTEPFECTTTNRKWKGNFVQRSGDFHEIDPIPMKGFQGFRYFTMPITDKIIKESQQ